MVLAVGNDHTAITLKKALIAHLTQRGVTVVDAGTENGDCAEYPVFAEQVAQSVADGECDKGLLLCGTGVGMCLAANKVRGIRAVVCSEPYTAKLSRAHNDSNILCLGARVVGEELAKMVLDVWLDTPFDGGRHQTRVDMIMDIETRNTKHETRNTIG